MESNLREFEGKMVFEDLKKLFISEKKVIKDYSENMLVFKDEGINNKEEVNFDRNTIVSTPVLPKRVKKLANAETQKMIDFSNEHINQSAFKSDDIICKSFEIEFDNDIYVILFEFLNTNDFFEDYLLFYEDDDVTCEFAIDFIYKPRTMYIYKNADISNLLYKVKIKTPEISHHNFNISRLKNMLKENLALSLLEDTTKIHYHLEKLKERNFNNLKNYDEAIEEAKIASKTSKNRYFIIKNLVYEISLKYVKESFHFTNKITVNLHSYSYINLVLCILNSNFITLI
jgi:hypothetical protein